MGIHSTLEIPFISVGLTAFMQVVFHKYSLFKGMMHHYML